MSRGFLFLWGTQLVSLLGSSMTAFGISLWVFETTQSPYYMTLALFCKLGPSIYMSFFAGQIVDRFDAKKVFLLTDLGLLVITILLITAYTFQSLTLWILFPALVLTGIVESVQSLAFQSSVALFNKPEFYLRSQGVVSLVENAPVILSPFLGALAYESLGLGGIFAFDIVSFLVALIAVLMMRFPVREKVISKPWFSLDAVRFIWGHPLLSRLQLFFASYNFVNGIMGGLLAAYILSSTGGDKSSLATVNTVMAVGTVLGSLFLLRGKLTGSMLIWIIAGTMIAGLTGRIGLALTSSVFAWSILISVRAFLGPVVSGANQALWLDHVEKSQMGTVFGVRRLFGQGLYPLAILLGGVLSKSVSLVTLFIFAGLLELVIGIVGFVLLRGFRQPL